MRAMVDSRPSERSRRGHVRRLSAVVLFSLTVIAGLIHVTVRDSWPLTGLFFYATPIPVLVLLAFVGLVLFWPRRKRVWLVSTLVLAVVAFGWFRQNYRSFTPPSGTLADVRVVFWNVFSFQGGTEEVGATVLASAPDIVVLVEANLFYENEHRKLSRSLGGMEVVDFEEGLVLATRGTVVGQWEGELADNGGRYALAQVTVRGRTVTVLAVDLPSVPWESRKEPLRNLAELTEMLPYRNLLIVGDFNTPSNSVHFTPLRESFSNAFDLAGQGWRPTWPTAWPLLELDQAWVHPDLEVREIHHRSSPLSDHEMIVIGIVP